MNKSPKAFQVRIIRFPNNNNNAQISPLLKKPLIVKSLSPKPRSSSKSPISISPKAFLYTEDHYKGSIIKKKHKFLINELTKAFPSQNALEIIRNYLKTSIFKIFERQRVSETFAALFQAIKDCKSLHFLAYACLVLGKILYRFNDFLESLRFLRMSRLTISSISDVSYKYRMYKYMSLCLIGLKSYEKAHKYAVKLLKLALIFQSQDLESYAYDLLGKIYFYISDFKTAAEYHEKMLHCQKTQELLNIGHLLKAKFIEKNRNFKKDPSLTSCEEEDLDLLDNFHHKKDRGRQNERGVLQKGLFSHMSNERGDPKANLQEIKKEEEIEKRKIGKLSTLQVLEIGEIAKKKKKLKEFFIKTTKYAKGKLGLLLMIVNNVNKDFI